MTGQQRFVVSARVIGTVIRDTSKLKMFMLSVLWSDEAEVIVYRSFKDFRKLHMQLKRKFHHTLIHRVRTIPKFRGKAWKSSQQRGSQRSVLRMRFLESYCDKLLKCDQPVTQSSEVIDFFNPKDHDLLSDFTKNSIMIMLADEPQVGEERGCPGSVGNITNPFVTQTYCCVEAYETKDTKNRPFKVAQDEKVDVLIKDPAGWWLVENENKCLAWFPAPYLTLLGDDDDEDEGFQSAGGIYRAIRSYSSKKRDEVSVSIGSVVEVLRMSDNGWWLIRFNGKSGYIPSMYLQPYNDPRMGFQKKMHSSTMNLDNQGSQFLHPTQSNSTDRPRSQAGRMHRAQSLDIISEKWSDTFLAGNARSADGRSDSRSSEESSFSSFSSGSSSYQSDQKSDHPRLSPQTSDSDSTSIDISVSDTSSSEESPVGDVPRVPPRPREDEILARCTTITRKAALATKNRILPQTIHSR